MLQPHIGLGARGLRDPRSLNNISRLDGQVPTECEVYTDGGYQDGLATIGAMVLARVRVQVAT